jgi:telomere length regulation protein
MFFAAHTQVVLLSAGHVQRSSPLKVKMLTRSGGYLQAVSNRLAASQTKARVLGMIIGEAISSLSDTKLDFKMDELDTEEARWLKSLVKTSDQVGPIDKLLTKAEPPTKPASANPKAKATSQKQKRAPITPRQTGFVIEEVDDSEEDEDADLVSYSKPDYDPEDSDEDATMVRRDKPKPPVYIRDLIAYLRDTESYDKQKLALETAPVLIRRKANFGTEVSEHAEELAGLLVGLQDKFEMDGFFEQRTQGMIAIIVAQPKAMAPWFAKTFFDGDYSISQRASILIVLGLGAREVAGFDVSEHAAAATFPSKQLPERMERMYIDDNTPGSAMMLQSSGRGANLKALPSTALDNIAQDLTSSFLAPLAANAADQATGPDVLKLSTFTSRLNNKGGKSAGTKAKPRIRAIPNTTASLLAASFFAPLTARFQHALRSPASQRHGIVVFQPYLLSLYLKTLAILIHAAGPSTLSLPQMTSELWDLLLGVRGHVAGDLTATHALLIALAAMIEVNDNSGQGLGRLCAEMPREIVETSEWVSAVFNGLRGDDGGEESKVKTLAAGVLITLQEAMEKHRALLIGDMMGM